MPKIKNIFRKIKSRLNKKIVIVSVVILLIFAAYWYFTSQRKLKNIESAVIHRGEVAQDLILTGEVVATEHARLSFPTSGTISWIGVAEGDEVRKGQALSSLDKTVLAAAYQQALNNVRMYEASVASTYDSLKNKTTTETFAERSTRTTAEVAKDNAYDALRAAEYNLKNSTLIAPFAGKVTFVAHPFSGVNVLFSETQIEILNPATIYFEVTADQSEVINLTIGEAVKIVLDSFPDKELPGKITFIGLTPKEGEAGTVYKIKAAFDNLTEMEKAKIGMSGDAKFTLNKSEDVLYLPPNFVHSDVNGKYIYLNKPKNKIYLEVGLEGEERTEIKGDIKEGEIVFE